MRVHTQEFWLQVQQEHLDAPPTHAEYLCNSSETFRSAWLNPNKQGEIRDRAALFIEHDSHWQPLIALFHTSVVLFHATKDDALDPVSRRELRAQFIEWNIKRT
jgi:hypothetical protein